MKCSVLVCALFVIVTREISAFSVMHPHAQRPRATATARTSTTLSYSDNAMQPPVAAQKVEKSVRDLIIEKNYGKSKKSRTTKQQHRIVQIKSFEEFQRIVLQEKETKVVVRFLASWCPGCKATTPAYLRLTTKLQSENVLFVDCPLDAASKPFHEQLGVTAIPFVQIYDPTAGLIDERQVTRNNFFDFEEALRGHVQ